jgi:acyl-CoA thioesterase I
MAVAALALVIAGCSSVATTTSDLASCRPLPDGKGPFVYVAIGASDAVGFGADCEVTHGYVPLLGQKMPHGAKVVNLGIAGATVGVALQDELPAALAAKPNLVTVWLAANDFRAMENGTLTLAQYGKQLDQLLAGLHTLPNAHVFVANLPDLTKLPYFIHGTVPLATIAQQTQAWNVIIGNEIAKYGDVLVDLYHSDLANHPEYIFADGFHPSTLGYRALANIFWNSIAAHGGA